MQPLQISKVTNLQEAVNILTVVLETCEVLQTWQFKIKLICMNKRELPFWRNF